MSQKELDLHDVFKEQGRKLLNNLLKQQKSARSERAKLTWQKSARLGENVLALKHENNRRYRAQLLDPILGCMRLHMTNSEIANVFNDEGLKSVGGIRWTPDTVSNLKQALRKEYPEERTLFSTCKSFVNSKQEKRLTVEDLNKNFRSLLER